MIELTTSLLMLATTFSGYVGAKAQASQGMLADATRTNATTTVSQDIGDHPIQTNNTLVSTEAYVRDYFKDTPILAEVARCESGFRQFDSNGNVIRGKVNKGDIGIMQINKYYHEDDATKLGIDIYTIDGNLAYAEHLYQKYGLDPWVSSSKCWKQDDDTTGGALIARR